MRFARVAVVGTGLIGGSFALALRSKDLADRVVGFSPADGARAMRAGIVDELAPSLEAAVKESDLVVLAAPISANATAIRAIVPVLGESTLVTDLSSVKRPVVDAAVSAFGGTGMLRNFVPCHPIAGGERSGPEAARADLFAGCLTIISPLERSAPAQVDSLTALWSALGSRVQTMDVTEHDEAYAALSHWPHAVSFALAATVAHAGRQRDYTSLAGPGLRDMTRIAASSADLWADIVLANSDACLHQADDFVGRVQAMKDAIAQKDRPRLRALFDEGARWARPQPAPPSAEGGET